METMLGKCLPINLTRTALKGMVAPRHEDFTITAIPPTCIPCITGWRRNFKNQPELMEAAKKPMKMRMKYKKQESA